MNNIRLSLRTDHVSCHIDAASFCYHSANTRTTIFASSTIKQYNSQGHHITYGRFKILLWRYENLWLAVNWIDVYINVTVKQSGNRPGVA